MEVLRNYGIKLSIKYDTKEAVMIQRKFISHRQIILTNLETFYLVIFIVFITTVC